MGITGNILDLLTSYLTGRRQSVVIDGHKSDELIIKSGVPQGSVLGPLLFLIYINDIVDNLESTAFLFADDTSCFRPILNGNVQNAALAVNSDLEKIHKWSKQWLVTVNTSKTVVMLFSNKQTTSKLPLFSIGNFFSKSGYYS